MKVCFALVADMKMHNYARKLAFEINEKYDTGFIAARLPQHITLGPVFEVEDIKALEEYFDFIVDKMAPLEVTFKNIDLKLFGDEDEGLGVLWMDIKESNELRELHNRIYKDIEEYSWKAETWSSDEVYHFHSTIALGQQPQAVYKEIYRHIEDKAINHTCIIDEIAMFCTTEGDGKMGSYITYKILPL